MKISQPGHEGSPRVSGGTNTSISAIYGLAHEMEKILLTENKWSGESLNLNYSQKGQRTP
jgi:hypothetical protein